MYGYVLDMNYILRRVVHGVQVHLSMSGLELAVACLDKGYAVRG
jgi:hypothetical protein